MLAQEKKKRKEKKERKSTPAQEKKKNSQCQPKKKKKKVKRWSKVAAVGPSCVFIYKNTIELWKLKTENSLLLFSVSITHNSKIRELSDGNRVIVWPNNLFAIGPIIFELWVMKTENWVVETPYPNRLLVFLSQLWTHYTKHFSFGLLYWA